MSRARLKGLREAIRVAGMTRLVMGSDAEEVLRSAPLPVLLVRAGA